MGEMAAFRAKARGRVQGVNYRVFTQRHAVRLGISGCVRNLRDGSVEVNAEGDRIQLKRLLEILHRGPPGARVDAVETAWVEHTGEYRSFSVTG
jgi:acylphosphatase